MHLENNVGTADQFAPDPELGEGGPIAVLGQVGANIRVGEHIHVGEALAALHEGLGGPGGETALGLIGAALHVENDRIAFDLVLDGLHDVH